MTPMTYERVRSVTDAITAGNAQGARFLGGGTNLVDLMRKGVEDASHLIDITALRDTIEETAHGTLMIGGAARNSAVAAHPLVRSRYPMLSRAILAGASAQIRNMATVGGNLMQRTRCMYFADVAGSRCNKRIPGSGCDAIGGFNRYHAILGGSASCVATHPSDMCVALAALDALVHISGPDESRIVPVVDFHRLPGDRPDIETVLNPSEIIVAVELPAPAPGLNSAYRKVRDRASYAFGLVSVAAALTSPDSLHRDIRVAIGGIATKPWRASLIEQRLRDGPLNAHTISAAVDAELASAVLLPGNGFKLSLTKRVLTAVLEELTGERP